MTRPPGWIVLLVLGCLLLGWWLSNPAPSLPPPSPAAATTAGSVRADESSCPLPPLVESGAAPLQSDVPASMPALHVEGASLQPLAGFSVAARVLGREDYRMGREADFSPTDLALGWGRMTEDAVLAQLDISQVGRWYRYRWKDAPPIPLQEIIRSSANMHMIPADDAVAAALRDVERRRSRAHRRLAGADRHPRWMALAQLADPRRQRRRRLRTGLRVFDHARMRRRPLKPPARRSRPSISSRRRRSRPG